MRNAVILLFGLMAVVALVGCSSSEATGTAAATDDGSASTTAAPAVDTPDTGVSTTTTVPPLTHKAAVNFTFVVRSRGTTSVDLDDFAANVSRTLTAPQGWALDGLIAFRQTESLNSADLTVWIANPNDLPKFSSSCSAFYSCRVGNDVIINADRWATPPEIGLSADDYRRMVVNHEVGHYLGFGHTTCPQRGGPARIMQQQSKGGAFLGGCYATAWPSANERGVVARKYGLTL